LHRPLPPTLFPYTTLFRSYPRLRLAKFKNIFGERTALRSLRRKSIFSSPGLSPTVNPLFSQGMHRDHQRWYSHRLNRDMGVAIRSEERRVGQEGRARIGGD